MPYENEDLLLLALHWTPPLSPRSALYCVATLVLPAQRCHCARLVNAGKVSTFSCWYCIVGRFPFCHAVLSTLVLPERRRQCHT